jgi:hypothetical protein
MRKATFFLIIIFLANMFFIQLSEAENVYKIPGLVLGLRHSQNQGWPFAGQQSPQIIFYRGGDLGAPGGVGYQWFMVEDDMTSSPDKWKLPPGIVLGLIHSKNQYAKTGSIFAGITTSQRIPTVFGYNAYDGPEFFGLKKQIGGDRGAPSGHGFYWYESTGEGFKDWNIVNLLPKYTIIGLKHTMNQKNKTVMWMNKIYDPAIPNADPPPGFVRMVGGDLGAPGGQGYCWFEKVSGPVLLHHR